MDHPQLDPFGSPIPGSSANQPIPNTPTYTPPQFSPLPLQSRSKIPKIILTTLAFILVIGGGAFAYYKLLNPTVPPKEMILRSIANMRNNLSFAFNATSTGEVKSEIGYGIPSTSTYTVALDGAVDFHDRLMPIIELAVFADGKYRTASSTGSLKFDVSARIVERRFFVNIEDFNVSYKSSNPAEMNMPMIAGMINGVVGSISGDWIEFPQEYRDKATSTLEDIQNKNNQQRIIDYIIAMNYITYSENVGIEMINDIPTHHLKLYIQHGDELRNILRDLNKGKSNDSTDEIMKTLSQKIDVDMWIGKNEYLIYKIVTSPVTIINEKTKTRSVSSQEIVFSDYNKPLTTVVPKDSVLFEEVMRKALGGFFGQSTPMKPTTPTKTTTPSTKVKK